MTLVSRDSEDDSVDTTSASP